MHKPAKKVHETFYGNTRHSSIIIINDIHNNYDDNDDNNYNRTDIYIGCRYTSVVPWRSG